MKKVEPNRNVYVGHRYVPLILEEWDNKISYEGLSVVTHKGGSYTSKKRVPVGIDILNKEFWSLTGNYNAQVDYYREETSRVSEELFKKINREELNDFKSDINEDFTEFRTNTNSDINGFKSDINEDFTEFRTNTNSDIDGFKSDINSRLSLINDDIISRAINVRMPPYNAKGDGLTDDTEAIQNALNDAEGGTLIIPNTGNPYMINAEKEDAGTGASHNIEGYGGLQVPNNIHIIGNFSELKAITTTDGDYSVLSIRDVRNVVIDDLFVTGELEHHENTFGEWGFGVQFGNCKNIVLNNVHTSQCWGDGFYSRHDPENIVFNNCHSYNNRRQGLSIITGVNITLNDCHFHSIRGTKPEACVDIESNNPGEVVKNIVFNSCTFKDSLRGILVYPNGNTINDIYINNCQFEGNQHDILINGTNSGVVDGLSIRDVDAETVDIGQQFIRVLNVNIDNLNTESLIVRDGSNFNIINSDIKNYFSIGGVIDNVKISHINMIKSIGSQYSGISFTRATTNAENITISDSYFKDMERGIETNSSTDINCRNIKLKDNTFENVNDPIRTVFYDMLIKDNTFIECERPYLITAPSRNVIGVGNIFKNCESSGTIQSGVENGINEDNTVWN